MLRRSVRMCHSVYRNSVAFPLVLSAMAFALRVYRLDYQSLWFDEAWTANVVALDAASILQATAQDVHPPLYFLTLRFWTFLAGNSELSLRFFSLIPAFLSVPFVYALARKLQGRRAAIVAAAIVTVAPLQVYYAQEARSYSLMPLLTLASTYLLLRACAQRRLLTRSLASGKWVLGYVAVSVLALLTHYTAFYVLLAQQFFVIHWWRRRKRDPRPLLAAQLVIFLFCLPWLMYLWAHPLWKQVGFVLDRDPVGFRFLWLWRNLMAVSFGPTAIPPLAQSGSEVLHVIQVIVLAILMLGAVQVSRAATPAARDGGWIIIWVFVAGLVVVTFLTLPGDPRHIMMSTPSHYLLLAFGIQRIATGALLGERRIRHSATISTAGVVLVVAASAISLHNQYHDSQYRKADDFRSIIPAMEWLTRPNDAVVLTYNPLQQVLAYYWKGQAPESYFVPSMAEWAVGQFDQASAEAHLRNILGSHGRCWLLEDLGISLDSGAVERWLGENTFRVAQEKRGRTRISLFSVPQEELEPKQREVNFSNILLLHDPESASARVESGAPLHHVFHWTLLREVRSNFSISLRLSDDNGWTYAAQESLLSEHSHEAPPWSAGDEVDQRVGFLIPPGTPPGTYRLVLVVYSVETGLPLPTLEQRSTPLGTDVLVDQVDVMPASFNPSGELAPLDHPVQQDITDSLRILGYSGAPDRIVLGETILVDLYWQAIDKPTKDSLAAVALRDQQGSLAYQDAARPANGRYPFSAWSDGEILIDKRSVRVPADAIPGRRELVLVLIDPNAQEVMTQVDLGSVVIVDRSRQFNVPPIEHPLNATFGGKARLLGYELAPATATPGESLHLIVYWQAVAPMETSYTAFAHLIDDRQRIWGQIDTVPGRGTVPTTGWLPGEVIMDSYDIPVAAAAREGVYQIEVGLYNVASGQRLAAADDQGNALGNSVVLDTAVDMTSP